MLKLIYWLCFSLYAQTTPSHVIGQLDKVLREVSFVAVDKIN